MTHTLTHLLFITVFCYLTLSVLYLFILSLCGRLFAKRKISQKTNNGPAKRIAILVPAYREDEIILSTAHNLLELDYPRDLFDIYIIADSFHPRTLSQLRTLPIQVLEVSFDKSTKARSLNEAFRRIGRRYDIALISDSDNLLAPDFLQKVNIAFLDGDRAVQGRRVAKNLDTSFAILDACSEAINNHIFRKGTNAIGLSSAVCGSGMAFEYDLVKRVLEEIDAVGGFDKVLQLKLLKQGIFIRYLDNALVYDEKVDSPDAFSRQRKRWLASQSIYARKFFFPAFRELFKGNVSFFNLAIANYCLLPRSFLLLCLPILTLAGFALSQAWGIASMIVWIVFGVSLYIALPRVLINGDLLRAVSNLPKAISLMLGATLHAKKTDKAFIHTRHTRKDITNQEKSRI